MPSLLDIRRRIRSVKNTQQLTKAMKTVSAAKLRRTQERVFSARPYAFFVNGQEDPGDPIRVEVQSPSGVEWEWGPADAANPVAYHPPRA